MGFDATKAQQDIAPSFKFERVGDGLKMRITDIDDTVEIDDKFGQGDIKGVGRFLAIKGEVIACTGGNKDDNDTVTDVTIGDERSVLAQYEYKANGKTEFSPRPTVIARAIAKAITDAGAKNLEVGGELRVKHHELGKRNADHPEWNRPKLYEASYTPPVKSSNALNLADGEEPF